MARELTIVFVNLEDFATKIKALNRDAIEPLNKEFAYLIKQQSDARDLVPRLTGHLQDSATPLDILSTEWDGRFAFITYPVIYAPRLWFGVDFHFTTTENEYAQAKWLEPILSDHFWINFTLKQLFQKHVIDVGERDYGRFIEPDPESSE